MQESAQIGRRSCAESEGLKGCHGRTRTHYRQQPTATAQPAASTRVPIQAPATPNVHPGPTHHVNYRN